jgi:diguanylate cyclase (GGDEF)-like protein
MLDVGRRQEAQRLIRPVAFIVAYVVVAKVTTGLTLDNGFTAWYPPAGMALAYLIAVGPSGAGTVLAARLINTAVVFPDAWRHEADGVIARALAITACYTLGAYVLRRVRLDEARLRELSWFVLVGVVAVPLGAAVTVAVVSVVLLELDAASAYDAARTVWIGDAVAVAGIVPATLLVLAARAGRVPAPRLDRKQVGLQLVALVGAPAVALQIAEASGATGFLCLAVLPVVWVALRGDVVFAAVGLLVVNLSLTVTAGMAVGATARLSELQVVMIASALGALYVAAVTRTQKLMLSELTDSEERYRLVIDASPCLIVRFDLEANIRFVNRPPWLDDPSDVDWILAPISPTLSMLSDLDPARREHVEHDWEALAPDGRVHWFTARIGTERGSDGAVRGRIAMITDLSRQRQAEVELDRERWQDQLTGLANRRRFLDLLVPLSGRLDGSCLGIAMIDIDGFKAVNQGIGHDRADGLLIEIANRLRAAVGGEGVAARLAADEFAVALPVAGVEDMVAFGTQLVRELRVVVPLGEHQLLATSSVGVACGVTPRDPSLVMYEAESALHSAKEGGRDRCATFESGLHLAAVAREARLALIRDVLERDALVVHNQPIVELESGAIHGVEALVRLPDPAGGLLLPGSFIDLVETMGLDSELGALVLEQAARDLASWPDGLAESGVILSVNVTSRQLTNPGFVSRVLAVCRRHGIAPSRLRLELTETMVLADLDAAVVVLQELHAHGITAALDDFGVGYSSMSYLQRLPIDVLKIDRTFIGMIETDDRKSVLAQAIVSLAQTMDLVAVAEGVETSTQAELLGRMGCDQAQGFYLARPMAAEAIEALVCGAPVV